LEGPGQRRRAGAVQALDATLHHAVGEECDSVWLGREEET
jgi:hypothetical protein